MISRKILHLLLVAAILYATQNSLSEEAQFSDKSWKELAVDNRLSEADISLLGKNCILITDDAYKQIFSAYLEGKNPLFITSDSLLNAYHVLFEESFYRLEKKMASRLPDILTMILSNLEVFFEKTKETTGLLSKAKERAMLVTGIAQRLLDDSFRFKDSKLNKILDQEIKNILEGKTRKTPNWLGNPADQFIALDYSKYTPRGFYTRSEQLSRYFRAVSWLQSIPFRISKDEELLTILLLGNSMQSQEFDTIDEALSAIFQSEKSKQSYRLEFEKEEETKAFFRAYSSIVGTGDDWDLITAAEDAYRQLRDIIRDNDNLQKVRDDFKEKAAEYDEGSLINDQIRFAPDDPNSVAEPNFRIISAYRTPGGILFQKTTDLRSFERSYPVGLEIPIALGSKIARIYLNEPQKEDLLKAIDSCRKNFHGNSLYLKYLDALKSLFDEPEPDAPDFMKNDAWQIKSCNTVLAGWVQMRHTFALQAKQDVLYAGMTMVPEGFVEPDPEFFSRMADLVYRTKEIFKESGVFQTDYTYIIDSIIRFYDLLQSVKNEEELKKKFAKLPPEEIMSFQLPSILMDFGPSVAGYFSDTRFTENAQWFNTLAEDIKNGRLDKHPDVVKELEINSLDLESLWENLEKISRRLESITHKQLRGVLLNDSEIQFIKTYGESIAGIMLYQGNSYLTPNDDAPKIVDVFSNPQEGGYLHAGIGRARRLYVLYPWQGKQILCEGAIMPYYEVVTSKRLTDQDWRETLNSDKRPSSPEWMSMIVSNGKLGIPKIVEDH